MSIASTTEHPGAVQARPAVPWLTVVPLAVVMSYADGFWMTSLRGAVGAIERTQEPFTSWWRESTLLVPVYLFAVLGALTLALRWFGPTMRPKAVVVTALLVAVAGAVAGIGQIVASSVYDYYLQSDQLALMDSMHGICVGSCLEQAQQSTFAALVRAVVYISGFLLVTNLVLVGWVVAMRGGKLNVSTTRQQHAGAVDTPGMTRSRVDDLRLLLVAGLIGSAHIHAAVFPGQVTEWPAAGVFFLLLAVGEIAVVAMLLARRPHRSALLAAAVILAGPLVLWLYSRTAGLPFGPAAGLPLGLSDWVACALEVGALIAAVVLLRNTPSLRRRPPASAHVRSLILVAVIAVTAIGIAGTAQSWFDGLGSSDSQPEMTVPH